MPRDPFYNSSTWKRLRRLKLARDPVCEYCRRAPANEVDHVKAINQGGNPTAWENLQSSCHECHSRKTYYIERLGRARVPVKGCRADGTPLDPEHPWNRDTSVQGEGEIVGPGPLKREDENNLLELRAKDRARVEEHT